MRLGVSAVKHWRTCLTARTKQQVYLLEAVIAEIAAEQVLGTANRERLIHLDQMVQATLARIWGEETVGTLN